MSTPLIGTNINIAYSLDGKTWKYFGCARNAKVSKDRKSIAVSSPATGDSEEFIPGRKSWKMTSSGLLPNNLTEVEQLYQDGTVFYVSFREVDNPRGYEDRGRAFISKLNKTGNLRETGKLEIELQGTGALDYQWLTKEVTVFVKVTDADDYGFTALIKAIGLDTDARITIEYRLADGSVERLTFTPNSEGKIDAEEDFGLPYAGHDPQSGYGFFAISSKADILPKLTVIPLQS